MSVINEMLRSLDATEAEFIHTDSSANERTDNTPADSSATEIIEEGPSIFHRVLWMLLFITLPSIGYFWLHTDLAQIIEPNAVQSTQIALTEIKPHLTNVSQPETKAESPDLQHLSPSETSYEKPAQLSRSVELKPISPTTQPHRAYSVKVEEDNPANVSTASSSPLNAPANIAQNTHQDLVATDTKSINDHPFIAGTTSNKRSTKQERLEKDASVLHFTPHVKSAEDHLREHQHVAQRALLQNDYHTAEKALKAISELKPNAQNHLVDWLKVLLHVGPAEAEARIDSELMNTPDSAPFKQLKANSLIQQQRFREAYSLLSLQTPSLILHPDYYSLLALSAQQVGEHDVAFQYYSALVQSFPETGAFYAGAAISADHLQRYSVALPLYTRALQDIRLADALRAYALQRRSELLRANL